MECDVVIVGAGPAGLATAIRLAQLSKEQNQDLSVIVIEKGAEVGAHILSGLVMDTAGINALIPDWAEDPNFPLKTGTEQEIFSLLSAKKSWNFPAWFLPKVLKNRECQIGSLGEFCRWLAEKAEALGVEIYPGFAASQLLIDEDNRVTGIVTGDMGRNREGKPKAGFTPGMNLKARYTILAEGSRGSLSQIAIRHYGLNKDRDPQKYALAIKELWRIKPEYHQKGLVQHTIGWPLNLGSSGGGFLYHFSDNLVSFGLVTPLDYRNPLLFPFEEMQRLKLHPHIRPLFESGERLEYGARVITQGGWQSVPRLVFPGGCLAGDSAGFVNAVRIKGVHSALLTGKSCAETVFDALKEGRRHDSLLSYEENWRQGPVGRELYAARNFKPIWARLGIIGFLLSGFNLWFQQIFGFSLMGNWHHKRKDRENMQFLSEAKKRERLVFDGQITFDRLSSLPLSGVFHEEDQPCHLVLKDPHIPVEKCLPLYGEPSQYYCPAHVYEIVHDHENGTRFVINASNCIHCKTCDLKDPFGNIVWTPPEGGGGPNYQRM